MLPRRTPAELGESDAGQPPPIGDPSTGALAMDGGWALGHVITPQAHADSQAYPRGMLIRPADPQDDSVIAPGTDHLPGPRRPLVQRLWRGLDRSVGVMFELLLPAPT